MTQVLARPSIRPIVRIRRRPLPYWFLAGVVALATAALVGRLVGDAAAERARWGRLQPVVTLRHHVAAGERLTKRDVDVRMLPAVVASPGSLRALPAGAVAAVDLGAGEILMARRLLGRGPSAIAARLPRGTRGIAIPGTATLPLHIGDRVDVLATFDPEDAGGVQPTFSVERDAIVVHVGDDAVTVAVAARAAPQVAYAVTAGAVTLVLSARS